jgi:hypothetical protein
VLVNDYYIGDNVVLLFLAGVVVVVEGTGLMDENGEPVVE